MLRQEPRQRIHINPNFVVPLLLGLVKNKLQTPVQMRNLDIVHILLGTVAGMAHIWLCQAQTKLFKQICNIFTGTRYSSTKSYIFYLISTLSSAYAYT